MDQKFKLKFDMMQEGKPVNPTGAPASHENGMPDSEYPDAGHIRNICFVQTGGYRIFLSYSYLVATEFSPDENTVLLTFTSHSIILKGIYLSDLYYRIMQQLVKEIVCVDMRYNALNEKNEPVVNEIFVSKSES